VLENRERAVVQEDAVPWQCQVSQESGMGFEIMIGPDIFFPAHQPFPHKWLTSHLANLTESIASHSQVLVIRYTAAGTQRGAADTDCVKLTELRMKDDEIEEKMSMVASQPISPASTRRLLQQQAVYM